MQIIKHSKSRFEVVGEVCNDVKRMTFEPYSRMFANKAAAEADAKRWVRLTEVAKQDHADIKQARLRCAAEYLAARAARPSANQLSFGW